MLEEKPAIENTRGENRDKKMLEKKKTEIENTRGENRDRK